MDMLCLGDIDKLVNVKIVSLLVYETGFLSREYKGVLFSCFPQPGGIRNTTQAQGQLYWILVIVDELQYNML
jgi:hypothetical protein